MKSTTHNEPPLLIPTGLLYQTAENDAGTFFLDRMDQLIVRTKQTQRFFASLQPEAQKNDVLQEFNQAVARYKKTYGPALNEGQRKEFKKELNSLIEFSNFKSLQEFLRPFYAKARHLDANKKCLSVICSLVESFIQRHGSTWSSVTKKQFSFEASKKMTIFSFQSFLDSGMRRSQQESSVTHTRPFAK